MAFFFGIATAGRDKRKDGVFSPYIATPSPYYIGKEREVGVVVSPGWMGGLEKVERDLFSLFFFFFLLEKN